MDPVTCHSCKSDASFPEAALCLPAARVFDASQPSPARPATTGSPGGPGPLSPPVCPQASAALKMDAPGGDRGGTCSVRKW